jgi:predicted short-subunit dehydrogenase-like oxidoreductase (DUF2520 family)
MIQVCIVGTGKVAKAFANTIYSHQYFELVHVIGRSHIDFVKSLNSVTYSNNFTKLPACDLVIIAVSDDVIRTVSDQLPIADAVVVHTSGAGPIELLSKHNKRGVLYPLQTFSKDKTNSVDNIPLFWEATGGGTNSFLEKVATLLSHKSIKIKSNQRIAIHLAAVVVNNFTNHLYAEAKLFCDANDIDFSHLFPLIEETTRKIKNQNPQENQTGPAVRGDKETILRHREIDKRKELEDIYSLFTAQLLETRNEKL